ncbi:MAG: hypothetical protein ACRC80_26620 [Waterburya sp.]
MPTTVYKHNTYKPEACNEILNAGTLVLVAPLVGCSNYPVTHTLTAGAGAVAATTIALTSDQLLGTFLREGHVLHFGANTVTVAADVTVANAVTNVLVEPLTTAIAAAAVAETWAMSKILSPTNVPLNIEAQTVDRTDLNSFRGSMVKTLNNFKPQIQAIASLKDKALYDYIFDGANTTKDVFVNIVYTSNQIAIGRALVSGYNVDGNQAEIQRPQFTLEFQGADYEIYKPWIFETSANKTNVNNAMKLSGLELFS